MAPAVHLWAQPQSRQASALWVRRREGALQTGAGPSPAPAHPGTPSFVLLCEQVTPQVID